jgi:hypothetical protein
MKYLMFVLFALVMSQTCEAGHRHCRVENRLHRIEHRQDARIQRIEHRM